MTRSIYLFQTAINKCCLIKLLPYILFEEYIYILALEMASSGNHHCANCIGTLSFPIMACTSYVTKSLATRLDTTWSLCKILRVPYTRHVTNFTVRQNTGVSTPAVLQFPTVSERERETTPLLRACGWHVRTMNRISIGSLGRRSDRPVIGGDFVDALVPAG